VAVVIPALPKQTKPMVHLTPVSNQQWSSSPNCEPSISIASLQNPWLQPNSPIVENAESKTKTVIGGLIWWFQGCRYLITWFGCFWYKLERYNKTSPDFNEISNSIWLPHDRSATAAPVRTSIWSWWCCFSSGWTTIVSGTICNGNIRPSASSFFSFTRGSKPALMVSCLKSTKSTAGFSA